MSEDFSSKENVAAFAAEFFTASQFAAFDTRYRSSLNGICGLYDLCVSYGDLITTWEKKYADKCAYEESGVNWLELVEKLVNEVQSRSLNENHVICAKRFDLERLISQLDNYT